MLPNPIPDPVLSLVILEFTTNVQAAQSQVWGCFGKYISFRIRKYVFPKHWDLKIFSCVASLTVYWGIADVGLHSATRTSYTYMVESR